MFIFLKINKRLCDLAVAHDMPQNEATWPFSLVKLWNGFSSALEPERLYLGKIYPQSSSARLLADSLSVVSEFTIYGQSQAERELHPLPCLCIREGSAKPRALFCLHCFIHLEEKGQARGSGEKMPYELSKSVSFLCQQQGGKNRNKALTSRDTSRQIC